MNGFQTKGIDEDGTPDEIRGDTIILHDDNDSSPKVLKKVLIITPTESKRYEIRKTANKRYLLNK